MTLDRYDFLILEQLQQNGRISNQELADNINLSPSPCLRRVRQVGEAGLIDGYVALVNARKVGLTLMALLQVSMDRHIRERLDNFERTVGGTPGHLGCYF